MKPPHKQETRTQLRTRAEPKPSVQTGEVAGNRLNRTSLVQITEYHIHTPYRKGVVYSSIHYSDTQLSNSDSK